MSKTCSRCKVEKELTTDNFDPRSRNTDGYDGICRTCKSIGRKIRYAKNPEKYRTHNRALGLVPASRFSRFKKRCVYADKDFNLTFQQWSSLVLDKSCHYCEGPLETKGCALDRKDNAVGYSVENCVPCCKECNRIKGHILTYEEMLAVSKVLKEMRAK